MTCSFLMRIKLYRLISVVKIKKTEDLSSAIGMAGVLGFEPRKCQIQSLMPYRLAIPQCAYL